MKQVWEVVQLETHRKVRVKSYIYTVSPPVVSKGPGIWQFFSSHFLFKVSKITWEWCYNPLEFSIVCLCSTGCVLGGLRVSWGPCPEITGTTKVLASACAEGHDLGVSRHAGRLSDAVAISKKHFSHMLDLPLKVFISNAVTEECYIFLI